MKYIPHEDCDILIAFKDGTYYSLSNSEKLAYGETGVYITEIVHHKIRFIPYINIEYINSENLSGNL